MNYDFLIVFVGLSIVNVVFSTIRSIVTINGNKIVASLISGGYFAFYNIMMIYTVADFPMWQKCVITFVCNVVGVFFVKWGEEKTRKDKLWLVKITVPANNFSALYEEITCKDIPCTYYNLQKYYVLDCYCEKQEDTVFVTTLCQKYHGKMFASENKLT